MRLRNDQYFRSSSQTATQINNGFETIIALIILSALPNLLISFRRLKDVYAKKISKSKRFKTKYTAEMETDRVDRPVGLPVGSKFFDRPVSRLKHRSNSPFLQLKDI